MKYSEKIFSISLQKELVFRNKNEALASSFKKKKQNFTKVQIT